MRPELEADILPPFSTEARNAWGRFTAAYQSGMVIVQGNSRIARHGTIRTLIKDYFLKQR
jgi:hypothetical protein